MENQADISIEMLIDHFGHIALIGVIYIYTVLTSCFSDDRLSFPIVCIYSGLEIN